MAIEKDVLDQLLAGRDPGELFAKDGLLDELKKALSERMLAAELDDQLENESAAGAFNRRNGSSKKTVLTGTSKVTLEVPRDRAGTFDPKLIAKYQRHFPDFDDKIISMYVRGMTVREICGHLGGSRTAGCPPRHGRSQTPSLRVLSALDLEAQIHSDGATWLDRQLLARDPVPVVQGGFGLAIEAALEHRRQHHFAHGDGHRDADGGVRYRRNLLATLERRELARTGGELAATHAVRFRMSAPGDTIRGTYREAVLLASGRYTLVENAQEFTLAPWRPVIERSLGREVVGLVTDGGISWQIGRSRGLGI